MTTFVNSSQQPRSFVVGTSASASGYAAKKQPSTASAPFRPSFLPLAYDQDTSDASDPESSPTMSRDSPPPFQRRSASSSSSSDESDGIRTPESPFDRLPVHHDNISWESLELPGPASDLRPFTSSKAAGKRPATANDRQLSASSSQDTLVIDIEPTFPLTASAPEAQEPLYEDERHRGRSPWPRILWRSEIDREALGIISDYHLRAMGSPLPQLPSRGQRTHSRVGLWSRKLEKAGL